MSSAHAGGPGPCAHILLHSPFETLAGENISARFVIPTVAASVDLVVHLAHDPRGTRRVTEIVAVPGRMEAEVIETAPVFEWRDGQLQRGTGVPPRLEHFERIGIDVLRLLNEAR